MALRLFLHSDLKSIPVPQAKLLEYTGRDDCHFPLSLSEFAVTVGRRPVPCNAQKTPDNRCRIFFVKIDRSRAITPPYLRSSLHFKSRSSDAQLPRYPFAGCAVRLGDA